MTHTNTLFLEALKASLTGYLVTWDRETVSPDELSSTIGNAIKLQTIGTLTPLKEI